MLLPFILSERLEAKLESVEDKTFAINVLRIVNAYSEIPLDNRMFFFPEYTDHGIGHIERVLEIIDKLIPDDTYKNLTPEDIGVIIIAVVLHDIGMQTSIDLFKNMINGAYDAVCKQEFKDKKWNELWEDYLKESMYWDQEKHNIILGENPCSEVNVTIPDLNDSRKDKVYNRKFIGEFIRKHHHRLAHDIASLSYIGNNPILNMDEFDDDFKEYIDLAGIVARSHGMDVRDTYKYLHEKHYSLWSTPLNTHVVYLMALLRLADYLDITKKRTNKSKQKVQKMNSPFSRLEHVGHNAIKNIYFGEKNDKELIEIETRFPENNEENVKAYVKIKALVEDIQNELDKSYAILGEVYHNEYTLQFRRIKTSISDEDFERTHKCIPRQFSYKFNNIFPKYLIKPLYGDNPSYGVRELVQNAVDACRVAKYLISVGEAPPHVTVDLNTEMKRFTIIDTGIGMTLEEIEKYFLTIGSSFSDSIVWKIMKNNTNNEKKDSENNSYKIFRAGRFGIGVLAAYLLGDQITVTTKSRRKNNTFGYTFAASLQNNYFEIHKDETAEYGTTISISIKCENENNNLNILKTELSKQKLFIDGKKLVRKNLVGGREWYAWYIDEVPKVEYLCDGKHIKLDRSNLERFKLLHHSSEKYGIIKWRSHPVFLESIPSLFCNGIFITDTSLKRSFSDKIINDYYPFCFPDLQIIDLNNELPLDLSRSMINENVSYAFEPELAKEVCKDLICQLMALDLGSTIDREKVLDNFFFSDKGFTIVNSYTKSRLNGKKIVNFYLGRAFDRPIESSIIKWKEAFQKYPNDIFMFSTSYGISTDEAISISRHLLDSNLSHLVNIDSDLYDIYEGAAVNHGIYDELIVLERYSIYDPTSENTSQFKALIDCYNPKCKPEEYIEMRKILAIAVDNIMSGDFAPELDELFKKYLGEDPIIPYGINERKEKIQLICENLTEEEKTEFMEGICNYNGEFKEL